MKLELSIPKHVTHVTETLEAKGFPAYLVGGCVRDIIRNQIPKDWDVTTSATPEQIQAIFPKTFYANTFGTVSVVALDREAVGDTQFSDELILKPNESIVEVTPFRTDGIYSDKRHPDTVSFSTDVKDDIARRDFTINALAYRPHTGELIDLYGGIRDLQAGIIRAVGDARARMSEDALRMIRAVRFSAQLGYQIDPELAGVLADQNQNLKDISAERIRDEFSKMLMTDKPMEGIQKLHETKLLAHIAPEIEEGIGIEQNGDHIYHVWEHNLYALRHAGERNWPLHVRLGALFHDVGKPRTRQYSAEKDDYTFYGHDVVGAKMTRDLLRRLNYSSKINDAVSKLVRYHLFFSDIDKITLSAVRRIVRNVGKEYVWDLMNIRACDRIGMGRPKEVPYRLRKYESMIEEAMRSPVSVAQLAINGEDLKKSGITPGPAMGAILHALLEEVLDNPALNTKDTLLAKAKSLSELPAKDLLALGKEAKDKKEELEQAEIAEIRKKYKVK